MLEGWDDEQLLAALRDAMRSRQDVPAEFIEMGKNAYAWRDIDAELAQLTYDSCHEPDLEQFASTRSENASIRALTFTSVHLSLELEVAEGSLLGQVIPPRAGTLETQTRAGARTTTPIDEIGCFAVAPIPAGPFRLHCRTDDGADVLTGWITLLFQLLRGAGAGVLLAGARESLRAGLEDEALDRKRDREVQQQGRRTQTCLRALTVDEIVIAQVSGQRDDPEQGGEPVSLAPGLASLYPHARGGRADRAEGRGDDQTARERDRDPRTVVSLVQELHQFDHADDTENQRQPHVVADRAGLQLSEQDKDEDR